MNQFEFFRTWKRQDVATLIDALDTAIFWLEPGGADEAEGVAAMKRMREGLNGIVPTINRIDPPAAVA